MKMKLRTILFAFAAVALLFSCANPLMDVQKGLSVTAPAGYGKVKVGVAGQNMKTVFPKAVFDKYDYTFTKGMDVVTGTDIIDGSTYTLEVGLWTVRVDAYIGAVIAATGTNTVNVTNGGIIPVTVNIKADAESGTGTFNLAIAYPAEAAIKSVTLKNLSSSIDAPATTNTATQYDWTNIPAGYYYLTVLMEKDNGTFAGTNEVVHIYNGMTSEHAITFEDVDFTVSTTVSVGDLFGFAWLTTVDGIFSSINAEIADGAVSVDGSLDVDEGASWGGFAGLLGIANDPASISAIRTNNQLWLTIESAGNKTYRVDLITEETNVDGNYDHYGIEVETKGLPGGELIIIDIDSEKLNQGGWGVPELFVQDHITGIQISPCASKEDFIFVVKDVAFNQYDNGGVTAVGSVMGFEWTTVTDPTSSATASIGGGGMGGEFVTVSGTKAPFRGVDTYVALQGDLEPESLAYLAQMGTIAQLSFTASSAIPGYYSIAFITPETEATGYNHYRATFPVTMTPQTITINIPGDLAQPWVGEKGPAEFFSENITGLQFSTADDEGTFNLSVSDIQAIPAGSGLGSVPGTPTEPQYFTDMTATQLVSSIKIGWNLGNTLDAHGADKSWTVAELETQWGNPVTTQATIDAIYNAGFNTIRLPVSWSNATDTNYNIRADWMARVVEVVNYAASKDMYIILNTHHDEDLFTFRNDPEKLTVAQGQAAFRKIWEQVADTFKNYNEKLIFEGLNEPRTPGSDNQWTGGTPEERTNLNAYYPIFVDVVRNSGGNNDKRILQINAYAASTSYDAMNALVLPADTVANKLIVSFHSYTPYDLALNPDPTKNTWSAGNEADTSPITSPIDNYYNKFVANGIPVIIGEFGAMNKDNEPTRAEWARFFVSYALSKDMKCVWWDNGVTASVNDDDELFGLLDRSTNAIIYPTLLGGMMYGAENPYGSSAGGGTQEQLGDAFGFSWQTNVDSGSTVTGGISGGMSGAQITLAGNLRSPIGEDYGYNELLGTPDPATLARMKGSTRIQITVDVAVEGNYRITLPTTDTEATYSHWGTTRWFDVGTYTVMIDYNTFDPGWLLPTDPFLPERIIGIQISPYNSGSFGFTIQGIEFEYVYDNTFGFLGNPSLGVGSGDVFGEESQLKFDTLSNWDGKLAQVQQATHIELNFENPIMGGVEVVTGTEDGSEWWNPVQVVDASGNAIGGSSLSNDNKTLTIDLSVLPRASRTYMAFTVTYYVGATKMRGLGFQSSRLVGYNYGALGEPISRGAENDNRNQLAFFVSGTQLEALKTASQLELNFGNEKPIYGTLTITWQDTTGWSWHELFVMDDQYNWVVQPSVGTLSADGKTLTLNLNRLRNASSDKRPEVYFADQTEVQIVISYYGDGGVDGLNFQSARLIP